MGTVYTVTNGHRPHNHKPQKKGYHENPPSSPSLAYSVVSTSLGTISRQFGEPTMNPSH